MAHSIKEKLPKAKYVINISVLDRLGGNKIFYKFAHQEDTSTEDKIVEELKRMGVSKEELMKTHVTSKTEEDDVSEISSNDRDKKKK